MSGNREGYNKRKNGSHLDQEPEINGKETKNNNRAPIDYSHEKSRRISVKHESLTQHEEPHKRHYHNNQTKADTSKSPTNDLKTNIRKSLKSKPLRSKIAALIGLICCILIVSGVVLAFTQFGENSRAHAKKITPQEILPTLTYTYNDALVITGIKTQDEVDKEKREALTYLIPPKAKEYDPIVYSYPAAGKRVSLTFDDGPSTKMVDSYLDVLKQNNVKASFFMLARSVKAFPEEAKRVSAAGHDVVSHSEKHSILTKLPSTALQEDFANTNKVFKEILGYTPKLMRPPYGSYNDEVLATSRKYGQIPIYWSIDTNDWRKYSTETMVNTIKSELSDGAIILMHEGKANTLEALPTIIQTVRDCGYEFVPLSEMLTY